MSLANLISMASCLPLLLLLLLVVADQRLTAVNGETVDRLPSIWDSAPSGSYHVLYQLEMANSDQVLTLEEWASYNERLFRLDLIGSNKRTSYLTNGATGELLRYKPFVCDLIDENSAEDFGTIAQLFMGYRWDMVEALKLESNKESASNKSGSPGRPVSAYGLGPLWLRANQDAQQIEYTKRINGTLPLAGYDQYTVTMKKDLIKDQLDYKVRFYFAEGAHFAEFVDWINGLSDETIEARARIIQVDYRSLPMESIFEIPVGYGCPRLPGLDLALDIEIGQMLLHQGAPNQASFEVITSGPAGDSPRDSSPFSWISQRYNIRMLRLSENRMDSVDKTESYYATLMQFRDTTSSTNFSASFSAGNSKLRRIKRVWWAPDSKRGQATVYTIDQANGECQVGHQDVRNQILLNFAGGLPVAAAAAASLYQASSINEIREEGALSSRPMVISVDQISFLFSDELDYHLIQLGETFGPNAKTSKRFRNRVYEKRLTNFELLDGEGSISWRGPVSIIKHISTLPHVLDSASAWADALADSAGKQPTRLTLATDYRTRLTLLFYSPDDMSRLMYKAVIELLDNQEVSLEYAHEQLDVSSCFSNDDKQAIVIKYPLESFELSQALQEKQGVLKNQIFVRLFSFLSSAFSTLQIYAIEPTFEAFNMRLQMSILDMPLTHTFQLERGLKLVETSASSSSSLALIKTTSSTADACADHCEHYNCLRFSFDATSRSCNIELIGELVKSVESKTSELYTYLERRETRLLPREHNSSDDKNVSSSSGNARSRAHFSADSIIEYLEELVEAAAAAEQVSQEEKSSSSGLGGAAVAAAENALLLKLDLAPNLINLSARGDIDKHKFVTLWPASLEHDLENMQEYSRELEESTPTENNDGEKQQQEQQKQQQQVVRVSGRSPRLQFNILLEDRVLDNILDDKLEGVTYEECERHCELIDCRTFSYCFRDETCHTSWQHNEKFIRATTKQAPLPWQCNVYSLDYLSKFESYGRALAPLEAAGHEDALSARDCANACMDRQNFQCQGFYFCRLPQMQTAQMQAASNLQTTQTSYKCYLVDWHVNSMMEHERSLLLNPAHPTSQEVDGGRNSSSSTLARECDFYSRSFLAQFDKYLGRRLDLGKASEMGVTMRVGHDLEFCAKQCITMGCLGFDACPDTPTNGADLGASGRLQAAASKSRLTSCHLAIKSIRGSQLAREKSCTTFVLSDKSHFNRQKLKLIRDEASGPGQTILKPDKEANIGRSTGSEQTEEAQASGKSSSPADVNEQELELLENYGKIGQDARGATLIGTATGNSHWLGKIFSLALGVLLGFSFILGWNEAYARGWLTSARARLGSRF